MDLLVKGMKMPMCCDDCPVFDDNGDYPTCILTGLSRGYNFPIFEKRMDNCPLVPIPPHGRVIDADKLPVVDFFDNENWYMVVHKEDIDNSPTIIEAEH